MNNTNRHNIPDMSNLPNLHNNMSMNPQLSLSMPPSSMNMNMGGNMNMNSHLSLGLDLDLDMDDLSDDDILATSIGGMSSGSMDGGQHGHNNGGMEHRQNGGNRNGNGNSPPGSLHYQPTRNDEMQGIPLGYENRHPSNLSHGANGPHGSGTVNTSDLTGSMQPQGGRYDMGSHTVGAPPPSSTQGQQRHQQYQQQVEQTANRDPPANPVPPGLSEDKARALEALLVKFWTRQMDLAERGSEGGSSAQQNGSSGGQDAANGGKDEFKNFALPLARIKKVMKSDPEVKMISAEVPVLLGKCCEIFIAELTSRAWLVAQSNKRRTLQKSDVAAAIGYSDMFDFLIDIVPRDEAKAAGTDSNNAGGNGGSNNNNSGGTANAVTAGTVDGTVPVPGLGAKRKNPGDDEDDLGRKRQREEADDSD